MNPIVPEIVPPPPLDQIVRDVTALRSRWRDDAHALAEIGEHLERAAGFFQIHGSRAGWRRFLKVYLALDEETARRIIQIARIRRVSAQAFEELAAAPNHLLAIASLPDDAFARIRFDDPYIVPGRDVARRLAEMTADELALVLDRLEGRRAERPSGVSFARAHAMAISLVLFTGAGEHADAHEEVLRSVETWVQTHDLSPRLAGPADTKETLAAKVVDQADAIAVALSAWERTPGTASAEALRRLRERIASLAAAARRLAGPASQRKPPQGRTSTRRPNRRR